MRCLRAKLQYNLKNKLKKLKIQFNVNIKYRKRLPPMPGSVV